VVAAMTDQIADSGRTLGAELCELWGLDAYLVERIVIDIGPSSLATATVTMLTDDCSARVIKSYALFPNNRSGAQA
jgi:hypothetical protein